MAWRSSGMPGVGVYLVKLSCRAWMAACLMGSGVGKSGSPGPKSTTSTPCALSLSASLRTARVAETPMRSTRSASLKVVVGTSGIVGALRLAQGAGEDDPQRKGDMHGLVRRDDVDHQRPAALFDADVLAPVLHVHQGEIFDARQL